MSPVAIQCQECLGEQHETPSVDENLTKKCPVHNSTSHALEECKKFEELPTLEKEKFVEEHRLCPSCLLPGHRLNKCSAKNRCKVEGCSMRHHTVVHEVDLNMLSYQEREKQKKWQWVKEPRNLLFRRMRTNL